MKKYSVKELADLANISVRSLHYYDQVGILKPQVNPKNKYRSYGDEDLERLQQILFLKELDFKIAEIKSILDSKEFDRLGALKGQKELVKKKIQRQERIIETIEKTIKDIEGGASMKKEDLFKGLDYEEINAHKEKYKKEVEEKYDPKLVEESNRRTSKYSKEEWTRIQKESSDIFNELASLMDRDVSDKRVHELIASYHKHIDKYFYPCSLELYRGLGQMYVGDERFTDFYDKIKEGLALFIRDAINYYVDNEN